MLGECRALLAAHPTSLLPAHLTASLALDCFDTAAGTPAVLSGSPQESPVCHADAAAKSEQAEKLAQSHPAHWLGSTAQGAHSVRLFWSQRLLC